MEVVHSFRRLSAGLTVLLCISGGLASAQSNACDLDGSGAVNVVDVTRAVNMALGSQPCSANVEGPLQCTVITVQRVVNAALGQPCVTYSQASKSVLVTWLSAGVVGYNVYRRVGTAGSFTKINGAMITTSSYTDTGVTLGTTYQYVVTSLDVNGNESGFSTPASVTVPTS